MMAVFDKLALVAVMTAVLSLGCTNAVEEPQFKITTKRDNDKVEVKVERDKRRLEKAIATLEGQHEVQVHWHPFQLNPAMPKEGISCREYRTRKFGSWERSLELDAKVIAVGQAEGIQFAFDKIERTPNTVNAHRLIWLADQHGCQDAVVEALFRAYFTDGRNISNRQTLIDIAAEAGLEGQVAETMLDSNEGMDVIEEAGELSRRHQVTGVPFFVINKEITLSGAQEPDTFLDAFRQVVG